jgi:hypothetical protein
LECVNDSFNETIHDGACICFRQARTLGDHSNDISLGQGRFSL